MHRSQTVKKSDRGTARPGSTTVFLYSSLNS